MQLDAIQIESGRGAILATKGSNEHVAGMVLLPFVFSSQGVAQQFLSACERSGVNLWPGMSHDELSKLFRLWHDSFKRPD